MREERFGKFPLKFPTPKSIPTLSVELGLVDERRARSEVLTVPNISSLYTGLVVPIPTFPPELMRRRSYVSVYNVINPPHEEVLPFVILNSPVVGSCFIVASRFPLFLNSIP
jgi:hypothetical protein